MHNGTRPTLRFQALVWQRLHFSLALITLISFENQFIIAPDGWPLRDF